MLYRLLVPDLYLLGGQGSQSDSPVAPVLGPNVPLGHGCSVPKLVPSGQKYPLGHSLGVCIPEPRTQRMATCSGDFMIVFLVTRAFLCVDPKLLPEH